VELQRGIPVALVLLPIRKMARGKRLDTTRRTGGVRGSRVYGILGLMAS
jgi:hypothetical protein